MVNTNLYILITLVILSILAFFIIKLRNKKRDRDELELMKVNLVHDPYEDEYIQELENEKQKTLDKEKQKVEEQKKVIKEKYVPVEEKKEINRVKREVPPHEKIVKDNFKTFSGMRILVAEDNLINQKVLTSLLADSGMKIVIADDGQIALDILEEDQDFTLVLMDAHMPRVDGFKATIAIRKNPRYDHIAVIALSGDTSIDDVRKMNEAGMENHLEKPINLDSLYNIFYAYTNIELEEVVIEEPEIEKEEEYILENVILDSKHGLKVCGDDYNFYKEILTEFISNYSKSDLWVHRLLREKKLEEATHVLRDISSVCFNIGANHLYELTLQFIDEIEKKELKKYAVTLKVYSKELKILLNEVNEYENIALMI